MFLMLTSSRRAIGAVAVLGLLAGCEVTVLDAAPPAGTAHCDAKLEGAWVAVGDSPVASAVVDDWCSAVVSGDGIPSGTRIGLRVLEDQGHWIAVEATEVEHVLPEGAAMAPVPNGSWIPLWWSRSGDGLVLGQPDARQVATLIAMDVVDGRVACDRLTNQVGVTDTLVNVIRPDALSQHETLFTPSSFQLAFRRVGESMADLEKVHKKEAAKRGSEVTP